MFLMRVAFRNVFRHKRRSLLIIVSIVIGIIIVIFIQSLFRGRRVTLNESVIRFKTGHLQLHARGYEEKSRRLPLDLSIENPDEIKAIIGDIEGIESITSRVEFSTMISNGVDTMMLLGIAVEPSKEEGRGLIDEMISEGSYLSDGDQGILIGEALAKAMGITLGDTVMLYSQTLYGAQNLMDFDVKGIFKTGSPFDKSAVFISLPKAQEFLDMGDSVTEVMIQLKDNDYLEKVTEEIAGRLNDHDIELHSWRYYARELLADLEGDSIFMAAFNIFLFFLVTIGIVDVMTMSVFERIREIGMIRAMGLKSREVVILFILEALIIGVIGAVIGSILGEAISWYFDVVGIPMPEMTKEIGVAIGDRLYASVSGRDVVLALAIGIIVAVFGSIYPAYIASKMRPVEALRHI